jgi:hypothetical protein
MVMSQTTQTRLNTNNIKNQMNLVFLLIETVKISVPNTKRRLCIKRIATGSKKKDLLDFVSIFVN